MRVTTPFSGIEKVIKVIGLNGLGKFCESPYSIGNPISSIDRTSASTSMDGLPKFPEKSTAAILQ